MAASTPFNKRTCHSHVRFCFPNSIHELQLKIPQSGDFAATVGHGKRGWSEDALLRVLVSSLLQVSDCPCDKDFNLMDTAHLNVAFCEMGQQLAS